MKYSLLTPAICGLLLAVSGCSGSGEAEEKTPANQTTNTQNNNSQQQVIETTASGPFAVVVGTWETSQDKLASADDAFTTLDESYALLREDGSATFYDYQGDDFGGFRNCYVKVDSTLTITDNKFSIDGKFTTIEPVDGTFLQATPAGNSQQAQRWDKVVLNESNFSQTCNPL